jgi:hypothetical protein
MNLPTQPAPGDVVIWDMEPEGTHSRYWVRTHSRGSATQLFEGTDAWTRAYSAAEELAGLDRTIWKRHTDGHFEKLNKS